MKMPLYTHIFLAIFSRGMSERSKSSFALETDRSNVNLVNVSLLEWKDSDLNIEKWEIPRNGIDGLFTDPEDVIMPQSLKPDRWIRAKNLAYLTGPLTVYTSLADYPDLITNNKHLLHSEFVRWFISAVTGLQYCGGEGLEISGEGSNFAWADRHNPWYGWMHVYSLNEAGKDLQHRPVINPNGKYIIRLHCAGCWRRVLVDDMIPVNKDGLPLLPRTSDSSELWPMLLAKALLKIASLTWTNRREIVDFHPIACLTGWTCLILNVMHLSPQDKWDSLRKYSKHFERTSRIVQDNVSENSNDVAIDETTKPEGSLRLSEKSPIALFLLLSDTRELESDTTPGFSPRWDRFIHVVQTRDIPLDPKDVKPPLARWKLHRWLKWATTRNLIDPADYFVPTRYLRIIDPFQVHNDSVVYASDASDTARNSSISSNEIERSAKSARRTTRVEKTSDLSIMTKEEAARDIGRWIDFNKMASRAKEVHLFYKLEYFQCTIQVTGDASKTINGNRKTTGTKEIKKEKADIYNNSSILKSRRKSLHLFCDSPEKKFFLISLCATPKRKNDIVRKRDYLMLKKHNWFFGPDQSDRSVIISTSGSKTTVMELSAGRQLLQIYRRPEDSLIILSSDTNFHIGDQATVQRLMTAESERIEQLSKAISDNLREAYRSFGTKDYPVMLKNYYRSYMPVTLVSSKKNKSSRTLIHDSFMREQIRLIREIVTDEEFGSVLRSLKVFYRNPNIKLELKFDLTTNPKALQDSETSRWLITSRKDVHLDLDLNKAATIIQSFFKMALVKIYKQLHDSDHALHAQIRQELAKVSDLFDTFLASRLLRNAINRHDDLCDLYPCSEDFAHVLNIQEYSGASSNVEHERWIPIVRFVVNPEPGKTVLAAFELLLDLPRYALRVFDNRSGRDMTRDVANHVAPARYAHLPDGYTVLAYGWREERRLEKVDWSIRVVTAKGEPTFGRLGIESFALTVEESIGTYVPNVRNCISRWILRATSGSLISARLTVSYNLAEVGLRITDGDGNALADANGGFTILLPSVILTYFPSGDEKDRAAEAKNRGVNEEFSQFRNATEEKRLYYMEAFVLNDSWPLTDIEWTVAIKTKTKKSAGDLEAKTQSGNEISSRSNLSRRDSKQSAGDLAPYWILQIITDASDAVEICEDKRREQEIALLKESWWSKDPGRSERGKELREIFLNAHGVEIESEEFLEPDERQRKMTEDDDMEFCLSHARQRRTLKPSSVPRRHLPALKLTRYMKRDETAKHRRIKTKEDDETQRDRHAVDIVNSEKIHSAYLENMAGLMNKQTRRCVKLFDRKKENLRRGRSLADAAYESRKIYLDNLISTRTRV